MVDKWHEIVLRIQAGDGLLSTVVQLVDKQPGIHIVSMRTVENDPEEVRGEVRGPAKYRSRQQHPRAIRGGTNGRPTAKDMVFKYITESRDNQNVKIEDIGKHLAANNLSKTTASPMCSMLFKLGKIRYVKAGVVGLVKEA